MSALVECKDGSSTLVKNVFYIPNLGVNLLCAKGLCKTGMQGSFDNKNIWIKDKEKLVIHAQQKDRLYIVKHITKYLKDTAFITQPLDGPALNMDKDSNPDPDESGEENLTSKVERHCYRKMHRRFGYCGPEVFRNLHKVMLLEKEIKIPTTSKRICGICKLAKMRNRTSKMPAKHKTEALALVHIDVAGPFSKSLRENKYFL
ncbi:hypothetical protein K3495_g6826 [Podosphaera aphanis]|nr:hypothetical protein K3495_g6826 [Podosphaera aphanis]